MQTLIPIPTSPVKTSPCVAFENPLSSPVGQQVVNSTHIPSATPAITVQDPLTGNFIQQIPAPPLVDNPPSTSVNSFTSVVQDPVTGQSHPKIVQTIKDPSMDQNSKLPARASQTSSNGDFFFQYSSWHDLTNFFSIQVHFSAGAPPQIITTTDPQTGQVIQQVVQTVVDPATGQTIQTMAPVSNGGGGATPVQVVTVQDPVTGQLTQQIVQTAVDPNTGEIMQIPLQNGSTIQLIFSGWVLIIFSLSSIDRKLTAGHHSH